MASEIKGDLKEQADTVRAVAGWLPKAVPEYREPQASEEHAKAQKEAMVARIGELIENPYTDPDMKTRLRAVLAVLQSAKGSAQINAALANVLATVTAASNATQPAITSQQQQEQKLWSDFAKCEREIQDTFEQLYKDGKISREQMEHLRSERTRLDALSKDSDERITGETKFATYQKELGVNVRDQAHKDGDHEAEKSADKVVHKADEQVKRLHEISGQIHEEKKETAKAKDGMHMSDDDPAAVSSSSDAKHGMAVANATLDDLQVPSCGKDRTSGRAITKS